MPSSGRVVWSLMVGEVVELGVAFSSAAAVWMAEARGVAVEVI